MNDMSTTIIAKSDQINAADLVGAPRTVTIQEVRIKGGDDQPVSIMIEGDSKAFRPCKGVRRLLVRVWGADANAYIGQSLTLFCDPTVTWAGRQEGGIRVSHMTGLEEAIVEYMRTSREKTKPYTIEPLRATKPPQPTPDEAREKAKVWTDAHLSAVQAATSAEELDALAAKAERALDRMQKAHPDLHQIITQAHTDKRAMLRAPAEDTDADPFAV